MVQTSVELVDQYALEAGAAEKTWPYLLSLSFSFRLKTDK